MSQGATHIRIRFLGKDPLDVFKPPGSLYLLRELISRTYRVTPELLEIRIDDERAIATVLTNDKAYRAALTKFSISGVLYLSVRVLDAPAVGDNMPLSPQQATLVNLQQSIEYVHDRYIRESETMDLAIRELYESALRGTEQTELKLNGTALDQESTSQLSSPLPLINSLTTIDLSGCRLTPDLLAQLCAGLKAQDQLSKLYLANNDLGEEGAEVLFTEVSALPMLRILSIEDNQLGAAGTLAITRMLMNSPKLERLSMQHNRLGVEGARHVAGIFSYCPNLYFLSLGNNIMMEDGARVLANSLPLLKELTHLLLDRNDFGPAGLAELCPVLSKFVRMFFLDLSSNKPGDSGASHITSLASRLPELDTLVIEAYCPRLDMIKASVRAGCYVRTV